MHLSFFFFFIKHFLLRQRTFGNSEKSPVSASRQATFCHFPHLVCRRFSLPGTELCLWGFELCGRFGLNWERLLVSLDCSTPDGGCQDCVVHFVFCRSKTFWQTWNSRLCRFCLLATNSIDLLRVYLTQSDAEWHHFFFSHNKWCLMITVSYWLEDFDLWQWVVFFPDPMNSLRPVKRRLDLTAVKLLLYFQCCPRDLTVCRSRRRRPWREDGHLRARRRLIKHFSVPTPHLFIFHYSRFFSLLLKGKIMKRGGGTWRERGRERGKRKKTTTPGPPCGLSRGTRDEEELFHFPHSAERVSRRPASAGY